VTVEEVRYVVAHGTLAPSGGNSQPWRFEWSGGELACRVDPGPSFLDHGGRAAPPAGRAAGAETGPPPPPPRPGPAGPPRGGAGRGDGRPGLFGAVRPRAAARRPPRPVRPGDAAADEPAAGSLPGAERRPRDRPGGGRVRTWGAAAAADRPGRAGGGRGSAGA